MNVLKGKRKKIRNQKNLQHVGGSKTQSAFIVIKIGELLSWVWLYFIEGEDRSRRRKKGLCWIFLFFVSLFFLFFYSSLVYIFIIIIIRGGRDRIEKRKKGLCSMFRFVLSLFILVFFFCFWASSFELRSFSHSLPLYVCLLARVGGALHIHTDWRREKE